MNDLVFSEVNDSMSEEAQKELTARGSAQGAAIIATGRSIWSGPNKVCMTYSVKHCAKPKGNSPNRMFRWQTVESFGFRRLPSGTIVPYHSRRDPAPSKNLPWRNVSPTQVFSSWNNDDARNKAFTQAIRDHLGLADFADLYPAAHHHGISKYMGMPWLLRGFYRAPDMNEFTARAFGKTRTDSKLVKAVSKSAPEIVGIAHQMRGLADINAIRKWIVMNDYDDYDSFFTMPRLRPIFLHINPESFKYLLENPMTETDRARLNSYWFRTTDNIQAYLQKIDNKNVVRNFRDLAY